MEELLFLGGLAAETFFEQSDASDDFVRNFMVSVLVLTNFSTVYRFENIRAYTSPCACVQYIGRSLSKG